MEAIKHSWNQYQNIDDGWTTKLGQTSKIQKEEPYPNYQDSKLNVKRYEPFGKEYDQYQ